MANINRKIVSKVSRVDPEFEKEMRELAKFRYMKNLERKEPKLSDMTRLLRRTDAWKQGIFELKTKPRREDIL